MMDNPIVTIDEMSADKHLLEAKPFAKIFERVKLRYELEICANDSDNYLAEHHTEFDNHTNFTQHTNASG
jgi:hypothetical protein